MLIICGVDTYHNFSHEKGLVELLGMSLAASKRALTYTLTDSMIYGNVTYSLAGMFLFPCWYLLWGLNFAKDPEPVPEAQKIENQNPPEKKDENKKSPKKKETKKNK